MHQPPAVTTAIIPEEHAATALLHSDRADAERHVNAARAAVLLLLAGAVALYAPRLTPGLTRVNLLVLAPMLAWTVILHVVSRRAAGLPAWLAFATGPIDVTAVTALLLGYGLVGSPDLAVKSPIWTAYFLILGARPFTSSARGAAITGLTAVAEYAAMAAFFLGTGRLATLATPLATPIGTGTSLLDEGAKLLLLAVAAGVATYATDRNESTLTRAEDTLLARDAGLRALLRAMTDVIVVIDGAGRYLEIAPSGATGLYRPRHELLGRLVHDIFPREQADLFLGCIRRALETERAVDVEYSLELASGVVWFAATVSRLREDAVVWVARDITERKALEGQLAHQAFHDPLTGLANRALFRDRVDHALARVERGREHIAVLFLDLDDFKSINDTLGHSEGDRLLTAVASRLRNATRGCDTVARLGGDEFAVLLEGVHEDAEALVVAERITTALHAPVTLEGKVVTVGVSTGIARAGDGDQSGDLLRNADVAMYIAKSQGKARHVVFEPAMHQALVERLSLESELRLAPERGELRLVYQPIVHLATGRVAGVEALVRWAHPRRGLLAPAAFIPLAEETALIVPLGRWVLREACREAACWTANHTAGSEPITISVNLSGRQLAHPDLLAHVEEALAESGLDPRRLVLEITESVIMQHTQATLDRLHALKQLGLRLAIDDFGTGYSSLTYLQHFPVDVLKIDRAFVERISRGGTDAALARTIIALGDTLSLRTVAEGVEEAAQRLALYELGCELAQGYFFARPLALPELHALLQRGATAGPPLTAMAGPLSAAVPAAGGRR